MMHFLQHSKKKCSYKVRINDYIRTIPHTHTQTDNAALCTNLHTRTHTGTVCNSRSGNSSQNLCLTRKFKPCGQNKDAILLFDLTVKTSSPLIITWLFWLNNNLGRKLMSLLYDLLCLSSVIYYYTCCKQVTESAHSPVSMARMML